MIDQGHKLIDWIIHILFSAEERRLSKIIEETVRMNQEAYGKSYDSFHYQGEFFRPENLRGQLTRTVLHPSLNARMDSYFVDRGTVQTDKQQLRQVFFKLLDPCKTGQDIRDVFPDCLTDTLPDWAKNLPRFNEPAFTINGDARAQRQYQKALPKIEFYSAARLLY